MSTSYPGALDNYTPKVDGVDTVAAAHLNDLQDAVRAVEQVLGTNPAGSYASVGAGLADKLSRAGDTMSGTLDMGGHAVSGLAFPMNGQDAATRQFVEEQVTPAGVRWRDDFLGARSSRWTLSGAGSYVQNAELGGTGDLSTGATTSNSAVLSFNGKGVTDKSKDPRLAARAKLGATTQLRAVLASLYKDDNNLVEVFYDAAATAGNFKYRCVSGGTETVVDSLKAADTAFHTFELQVDDQAGQVSFLVDGGNAGTISTNLPTLLLEPRFLVQTKEAVDMRLTVDLLHLSADR